MAKKGIAIVIAVGPKVRVAPHVRTTRKSAVKGHERAYPAKKPKGAPLPKGLGRI